MRKVLAIIYSLTPRLFILMPCITILGAILPFVNYFFSALIIDALSSSSGMNILLMYAAAAVGLNIAISLTMNALIGIRNVQIHHLTVRYEVKMGEKTLDMDYKDIESPIAHELKRAIDQTKMRIGGITAIAARIESILKSAISLILAFFAVWRLFSNHSNVNSLIHPSFWTSAWPPVILVIFVILSILWTGKIQLKANEKITDLNKRINEANGSAFLLMQLISDYRHGKDIRIYNLKELLTGYFQRLWDSSTGAQLFKEMTRLRGFPPSVSAATGAVISAMAFLLAGMKALSGEISVGNVVLYAGSIQVFVSNISVLMFSFGELLGHCDLQEPFLKFLEIPNTMSNGTTPIAKQKNTPYEIEFRNVSFKYPGNDVWVLRHLNFKIKLGERVAVVGMNGSGKTTMIKLLCRLYDPTEGVILLNGLDIKQYRRDDYWSLIAVVFQDFKLFSLPIGQNIAASLEVDHQKADEALVISGLKDRVSEMPKGLATPLFKDCEDDGVEVSGGESQKIAIARAVYKDAPVVVLDEPTSALDPVAEYEIYTKFDSLIGARTAIYISHRLSSCRFCQRIFVFSEGSIVQEGAHEHLVAINGGKYQELWNAQAQFYAN
ncbi:MAG: ABC transporter ATP-binding protein/permease [Firmicutes bacterium]|nr:ABC transporter ATP-binding protein/permease [Bacillota bacterium]